MAELVAILTDTLRDRYVLEKELGRGGMATVWLARDLRHHRPVAIKVLHPELSAILGSERFLKEIELTANLQHPHILPLFDSGEAGGLLYYVMPYVEGETLRRRLERERQLPVPDAVRIAAEVADALDYAHRRGVVHRDIKPENVLLHDGRPLVADFGIALAVQEAGGERMTQTGLSLGTPQYMAPEQAAGDRGIDGRADVYALGVVTYEMLAGDPPFTGRTAQVVVGRVLAEEPPPLRARRRSIPEHVEAAVLTALEKLPADRFSVAADFAAALRNSGGQVRARRGWESKKRSGALLSTAAAGAVVLAGLGAYLISEASIATPWERTLWLELVRPLGMAQLDGADLQLSPDGSRYLFARGRSSSPDVRLVVRGLSDTTETVLEGTAGVTQAIWSPDARSVAFLRGDPLKPKTLVILPLDGKPAAELIDSVSQLGAWLPGDTIIYTWDGSLMAVSAAGGKPRLVRAGDSAGTPTRFTFPAALPGRRVLTTVTAPSLAEWRIGVVSLNDGELRTLAPGVSARYLTSGHLLMAQADGRVLAARFDPAAGTLGGPTRPVLSGLNTRITGYVELSVADDGTVLYQAGGAGGVLVVVDRDGSERVLADEVRNYNDVAVSPDGRWVTTGIDGILWSLDIDRRTLNRLTVGSDDAPSGLALFPVWSPDGRSVAYSGVVDTFRVVPNEGGEPSVLFTVPGLRGGAAWSADGRSMLVSAGSGDLRVVELRTGAVKNFVTSRFVEQAPSFSPDGRWVAYTSDESGRSEVYVRRFPTGTGRSRISVDGGSEPIWSTGGGEIFFRGSRGFMAAALDVGTGVVVRRIERLFDDNRYQTSLRHREYGVFPGDTSFLFIRYADLGRIFVRFGLAASLDSILRGS